MAVAKAALFLAVMPVWSDLLNAVLADSNDLNSVGDLPQEGDLTPRRCVLFPRRVRPGTPLAALALWPGSEPRTLAARLTRDGREVATAAADLPPDAGAALLQLPVPLGSEPGRYRLRVEGGRGDGSGGSLFADEADLDFSPDFLAIVVHTSRPVYTGGQLVRFRVLLLTAEGKPYGDTVDVFVLDPDGLIMRRWVSMQTNNGVVSHRFRLPRLPKDGRWRLRVRAHGQLAEQPLHVDTFFVPLLEVHLSAPAYLPDSAAALPARACALSERQRASRGNVTLRLSARRLPPPPSQPAAAAAAPTAAPGPGPASERDFQTVWEHEAFLEADGCYSAEAPLGPARDALGGSLAGAELRLDAAATDLLFGQTALGFSHTRLVSAAVRLRFLGPRPLAFQPGAPFEGHVVAAHEDAEPLSPARLAGAWLRLHAAAHLRDGGVVPLPDIEAAPPDLEPGPEPETWPWSWPSDIDADSDADSEVLNSRAAADRFRRDGVFRFRLEVPETAERLELRAVYSDAGGAAAEARAAAVRFYGPRGLVLSLRSSTALAVPGEFAVFHAQANFPLGSFYYLAMSKGQLLFWGEQRASETRRSVTTFAVPVSLAMMPALRLVAVHVTAQGELLADSAEVPLAPFNHSRFYLQMNQGKDPSKRTTEAIMKGQAGAFLGMYAERAPAFQAQAGNGISKARVLQAFHRLGSGVHGTDWRVTWRSRDGLLPERHVYLAAGNPGVDANTTLAAAGLAVLTDAVVPRWPAAAGDCSEDGRPLVPCLTAGCYPADKRCDGQPDCQDASDENECPALEDRDLQYRLTRTSRTSALYDTLGGDWAWREMNDEYGGAEYFRIKLPPIADDWFVMGFTVSKERGFATIDFPVRRYNGSGWPELCLAQFSTERPFMFHLEGPSACRRGEQVGLRALLFNNMDTEALALLEVVGAPTHRFVHVEQGGIVSSYGARLEPGDHHHLVYLPPHSQQHVDIPIAPAIEQGDISIVVSATAQIGVFKHVHNMTVVAEGGLITKHTSVFLDLKNRALVLRYMAIFVDQSPVVPYQDWRRYIFGSTSGSVTVSGDVLGPIFSQIPLTVQSVMGMELKGTEASAFELANNVWTLHYLRLTNQLKPHFARRVLEEVNVLLGEVMRRYSTEGWFRNWDTSAPSVWLTSWVIRALKHGAFQDWEDYFYVQPEIFYNSVQWLLHYQSDEGYFNETLEYHFPMDPKIRIVSGNTTDPVALTAHVVITLLEVTQHIHGSLKTTMHTAILQALRFLEHKLPHLEDPYVIAITAYALTLSDSSEQDRAISLLQKNSRDIDKLMYWSRVPIPPNEIRNENQRPFIRPREHQEGDSLAVESTAYALLALLAWDGDTIDTERIVQWLNGVRMSNNGFISSMDSAIGLQALTEYAFRARLLAVTDMMVTVDMPSSNLSTSVHIGNTSLCSAETKEVPNVWGHVNLRAQGSGQGLAQMDVSFGIDFNALVETPIVRCFELQFHEYYSTFRNKSAVTIETCMRWLLNDPPVSGAAVLELETPTGYHLLESEAIHIAASGVHPTLRDARTLEGKTAWYFDHIPQEWTCFNHTVRRWFPVANMTQFRQAMLYEEYAREHFVHVLVNSTPLYVLSICEVCGSYQCPYCPHYSNATKYFANTVVLTCTFIILLAQT